MVPFPISTLKQSLSLPTASKGIIQKVLGADFKKLHPMLQARFGLHHEEGIACVGQGKMQRMESGNIWVKPFLWLGIRRNLLFPEQGAEIPFVIENYPFKNDQQEASLSFVSTFYFPKKVRRSDAFMMWDKKRERIKYTLGKKHRLVTDLSMEVDSRGHMLIRSERLNWLLGETRVPSWPGGYAEVEEWYEELEDRFHIRVSIAHPFFGKIYAYEGWFRCSFVQVDGLPGHI